MNRTYSNVLWSGLVMLVVAGGMGAQAPAPGSSTDTKSAAPQTTQATDSAQAKEQKAAPVYESATVLKTVTRLVVVDVVATDKNGAVTDLGRDDFTVLEDGKQQQVRVFNFQQPDRTKSSAVLVPPKLPEHFFTNIARYSSSSSLNVLLLDALNTNLPNQAYVRDQMIKYLERAPEGQPIAVYTLGNKLTLLQDFTTDPAVLKDVVKQLKTKSSVLLDNPGGGPDQELLPPGVADSGSMPAGMLAAMQTFEQERVSFQTDLRVQYTLNALGSITRALSGYPGRKNLIWVSEAFPIGIDPNLELNDAFTGTRNYAPQIAQAADALINAQIAVYPIDARGLMPPSQFNADSTGRDKFGRSLATGGRFASAIGKESADLQNAHEAMQEVAQRTGGMAFYNTNGLDAAVRDSIADGSIYYTLAYYPENKTWNGKFRKIQIKVNRPGIKLRYRLGYYAVDPRSFADQNQKQQASAFGLALDLDSPISTGLPFSAQVVPPEEKAPKTVLVNFGIDPHAVSFEKQNDGLEHATLECTVQVFSNKGKHIDSKLTTMNAALKPETFDRVMASSFPCQQKLDLEPGDYVLRLGVRDGHTGLIGTTNAKVAIAAGGSTPKKQP